MTKTFKEIIDGIRTAILGIEVREDIAQGMEYVEQFATTATQKADEAATSAAKAEKASQDTEAAKETAVSAINTAKSEATDEINTEKSGALSAIGNKKAESLQELSKKQGEALNEISKSVSAAQDAAGTAVQKAAAAAGSASNAAESEKNAKASANAAQEHQTGAEAAQKKAEDAADRAAAIVSTDKTLTVENAPADAKAVGEALKNLNIRPATSTTLGGIKVGSGLSVTEDGMLSADAQEYTLPPATTTELGGIIVGDGLRVSDKGVLSCDFVSPEVDKLTAYPVGSIYQSTSYTSPAALFGGTWQEIAQNRVLMGASYAHAAGTTVEAGLPNITGSFVADVKMGEHKVSGAFTAGDVIGVTGEYSNYSQVYKFSLDASKSNAIYGRSYTVQPAAYYVHIWKRVA